MVKNYLITTLVTYLLVAALTVYFMQQSKKLNPYWQVVSFKPLSSLEQLG